MPRPFDERIFDPRIFDTEPYKPSRPRNRTDYQSDEPTYLPARPGGRIPSR